MRNDNGQRKAVVNAHSTAFVWVRITNDPQFASLTGWSTSTSALPRRRMTSDGGRAKSIPIRSRTRSGPVGIRSRDSRRRRRRRIALKSVALTNSSYRIYLFYVGPGICSRTVHSEVATCKRPQPTARRRLQRTTTIAGCSKLSSVPAPAGNRTRHD